MQSSNYAFQDSKTQLAWVNTKNYMRCRSSAKPLPSAAFPSVSGVLGKGCLALCVGLSAEIHCLSSTGCIGKPLGTFDLTCVDEHAGVRNKRLASSDAGIGTKEKWAAVGALGDINVKGAKRGRVEVSVAATATSFDLVADGLGEDDVPQSQDSSSDWGAAHGFLASRAGTLLDDSTDEETVAPHCMLVLSLFDETPDSASTV